MTKFSASFILGFVLALIFSSPVHAQSGTTAPTDGNTTAGNPAPASQAPEDVMKRVSDLVHAGKYKEAQQSVTALLILYPDDPRLIKAKSLLDKALLSSKPADTSASTNQPTSSVAPSAQNADAEQLTGAEKVDYEALKELVRQAQQTTDLSEQKTLLKQFMDQSSSFLQKHPNDTTLWELRVASAMSLDDPIAGYEAGQKLLAMGAADGNDANLQRLLGGLKNKGWLDKERVEREAKYGWIAGTWSVGLNWWFLDGMSRDQEQFVLSDSVIEGYLIGRDGMKNTEPDLRGTILDSGEIKWEAYLPPSDAGELFVVRRINGGIFPNWTVGRRSEPLVFNGVDGYSSSESTGNQQFYPSGWQPVVSYEIGKDIRTMKIVFQSQDANPRSSFPAKHLVTLTFDKAGSAGDRQVHSQQVPR